MYEYIWHLNKYNIVEKGNHSVIKHTLLINDKPKKKTNIVYTFKQQLFSNIMHHESFMTSPSHITKFEFEQC